MHGIFFSDSSPFKFCQDNADGKACLNFTSVDLKKPSACVTAIIDIPHFNGSLDYGCAGFPPPAAKPDMPRNVQPGDKTSTYTGTIRGSRWRYGGVTFIFSLYVGLGPASTIHPP